MLASGQNYVGTNAERLGMAMPNPGSFFYEEDIGDLYIVNEAGAWQVVGAGMVQAQYLTLALHAALTNERRFVDGNGLTAVDGGAGGNYTLVLEEAYSPTWTGTHIFQQDTYLDDGVGDSPALHFVGASDEEATIHFDDAARSLVITLEDDKAEALRIIDNGDADIYLKIITTTGSEAVVFNEGGDDVDFLVKASGAANAFKLDGATGHVALNRAPTTDVHFYVYDNTLDITATYYGGRFYHLKTAGVTDLSDHLYGLFSQASVNHAQEIGNIYGVYYLSDLTDGVVGSAATDRALIGSYGRATLTGGTVYGTVEGAQIWADVNGGTVHTDGAGDVYGIRVRVDIEAAATIADDVFGVHIWVDDDAPCAGTSYMVYMEEKTNIDYGIYQNGIARHYLQGTIAIGGTDSTAAQVYIDQSSATGAIPVLYLDQADLSEEIFAVATTVGAGNPIDTAAIGTYYGKMRINVIGVGYKYIALYNS